MLLNYFSKGSKKLISNFITGHKLVILRYNVKNDKKALFIEIDYIKSNAFAFTKIINFNVFETLHCKSDIYIMRNVFALMVGCFLIMFLQLQLDISQSLKVKWEKI